MAKYLLDTDTIEFLGDTDSPYHISCIERLEALTEEDELCASVLSLYELEYGIAGASADLQLRLQLLKQKILDFYIVLPLTEQGSRIYGRIKYLFKQSFGTNYQTMKTHTVDMIIASTALEQNAILVSSDAIYQQLQGLEPALKRENWAVGS